MANMNLKDALERSLLATKEYIDKNKFSGDYNDLINRPCYDDSKLIEYIYDGDSTGKLIVDNTFVKVSDDTTITYEEFKNSIVTINNGGTIIEVIMSEEQENQMYSKVENETGSCYMMDEGIMMIVLNDNFEHSHTLFPEKGIYFIDYNLTSNGQMSAYTSKFSVNKSNIKQLDEKFIPDTIARVSDLEQAIEENGFSGDYNDLENKPCYDTREFETVQILCDGNFEGKETLDDIYFSPFAKIADLNDNDIDSILSNGLKAIIKIYQRGENDELVLIEDLVLYSLQPSGIYDGLYHMKDNEDVLIATKDITEPVSITKGLWVYNGNVDDDTLVYTYDISYDRCLSGELKQLDGVLLPEGLPYDTREFEEVKLAIDENFDITGKETVVWQREEKQNEETVTYSLMYAKLYDSDFDVRKVVHEGLLEFYGARCPASDYCFQLEEFYSIYDQFIVAEKDGTIFTKGIWGLYSIDGEICYNPDEDELMSLIFKTLKNGKLRIMDSKFIPYKPGLVIEEGTYVLPSIWYIDEKDGVYGTGDEECSIGKGAEIFNDYYTDINDYTSTLVNRNIAIGDYSHAEGRASYAKGYCSHTEGYSTYAAKDCTHAEGYFCQAVGEHSHAEGSLTQALGKNQHVQGILNIPDPDNKYVHIVGNGTLEDEEYLDGITLSNAHTLDWDGNAWFQGQVQGTNLPHDTRVFEEIEITFDGNIEGKETVLVKDPLAPVSLLDVDSKSAVTSNMRYVKASDKAISYEEFCSVISLTVASISDEGEFTEFEFPTEEMEQMLIKINDNVFVVVTPGVEYASPFIIITHENITVDSVINYIQNDLILTPGIWFLYYDVRVYISKFKYQSVSGELKKLDEKYLPDSIANGINVITRDDLDYIFDTIDDIIEGEK